MRSGSFSERMSIGNYRIEFFGPVDHALHFGFGGDSVAKIFGIVDLDELSVKIGSYAMSKLLDSITVQICKAFVGTERCLIGSRANLFEKIQTRFVDALCGSECKQFSLIVSAFAFAVFVNRHKRDAVEIPFVVFA